VTHDTRRRANGIWAQVQLRLCCSLFGLLVLAFPASAQTEMGRIGARPVLWIVHSRVATAYLLGSIHLLPPNLNWHTPAIDHAMKSADTFYFETSLDPISMAQMARFVLDHGSLADGQSLRAMLDKGTLSDFDRALSELHLRRDEFDGQRPWLASISLNQAYMRQMNYVMSAGVDMQVWDYARQNGKRLRSFETTDQQLALFMPRDPKLEVAEFDSDIRELHSEHKELGAMIDAWAAGDAKKVGELLNEELEKSPDTKRYLVDERNKNWMQRFDFMLSQNGTYFVVVGAGHLVGANGVPALLRARGYRVDGP